jgi:hypothetical protein
MGVVLGLGWHFKMKNGLEREPDFEKRQIE